MRSGRTASERDRPLARQPQRAEDPDLVDLGCARVADRPAARPRVDPRDESLPHRRRQELAVAQAGGRPARDRVDDDHADRHRPSQRTPPDLVAAGDGDSIGDEKVAFELEIGSAARGHVRFESEPGAVRTPTTVARGAPRGVAFRFMAHRRRVDVVPHTHWDREWYAPFRTFQLRLVDLVDDLLELMESDPSYARFLMDGQMAAVDDYLEVRPENEGRLRQLAAAGRITFGPWYVLMDEFLVSGETIVRNLQLGLERAAAFGGAMEIGYLPDMFGHVAQMPQLLAGAGFADAVVWRGVPSAVDKTAFFWAAPDGSVVRAEYLLGGYSTGASVGDDAKAFVTAAGIARRGAIGLPARARSPAPLPERHGSPEAPALARSGCGGGEWDPGSFRDRDLVAARGVARGAPHGVAALVRRAPVGSPGEHLDGRRLEPRRRQAGCRTSGAGARAARRTAGFALHGAWPVPGGAAQDRLAPGRAELGSRLDLRLLPRRGRCSRAAPLRRGEPDRRRSHRAGSRRARARRSPSRVTSPSIPRPDLDRASSS